jgi:hypothetical protein
VYGRKTVSEMGGGSFLYPWRNWETREGPGLSSPTGAGWEIGHGSGWKLSRPRWEKEEAIKKTLMQVPPSGASQGDFFC